MADLSFPLRRRNSMKKKMCSVLFVIGVLTALMLTTAWADESDVVDSGTCGDNLTWVLTEDGTLTISGTGDMKDWEPSTSLTTYPGWFSYYDDITTVVIEDGVTSIGEWAFYSCHSIESIELPDTLTNIGFRAFAYCHSLTEIQIPNGVTTIGDYAFSACTSLSLVEIPNTVTTIGKYAFTRCESLTEITFPASVTSIGGYLFYKAGIQEVTFKGDAPTMSSLTFGGVSVIAYYPAGNSTWNEETLIDYSGSVIWVAVNEDGSFEEEVWKSGACGSGLTWELTNTGVLTISGSGYMSSWDSPNSLPWLDECGLIRIVILEDGVTSIGNYAFYNCSALTEISIPDSVLRIGRNAFESCTSLTEIMIPGSVTSIGSNAFESCISLTSLSIPEGVVTIGENAFISCTGLTTVTIPASVESIGNSAFRYCISLVSFNVDSGNSYYCSIDDVLFDLTVTTLIQYPGQKSDTVYTIPDTVTTIEDYAFYKAEHLTEVIFPDSVTTIEQCAFFRSGLVQVTVGDGVTEIGGGAFSDCYSLVSITIGSNVNTISSSVFDDCTILEEIYFKGDAPNLDTQDWERVPSRLRILYHASKAGWENAQTDWDVPSTATWYDLDAVVDPEEFDVDTTLTIQIGQSSQITNNADPYTELFLTWSSSDLSIAYVNSNGIVTGLAEGSVMITVSSSDGRYSAQCTVTVTTASAEAVSTQIILSGAVVSNNISGNAYTKWAGTVKSYLYTNADGGLTRVEYVEDIGVVVETIDPATGNVTASLTVEMELSIWGGFYAGEEYNFLVFGQSNSSESDEAEVVRVVKYSKDWERLDACSIYGANTVTPFEAGSLRMTETNGSLYIHTSHLMYASSDGVCHQANMTFVIDEEGMTADSISSGYVSHSFNQFIQTDGEYVYLVDHGDAYPRAINVTSLILNDDIKYEGEAEVLAIQGEIGENYTGVSIGGFELSTDNCLIVGNSVDQSNANTYSSSGQRNIFLTVTEKYFCTTYTFDWGDSDDSAYSSARTITAEGNQSNTEVIWLTDYDSTDGVTPCTPQLVKLEDDLFLILWEEILDSGTITTCMVLVGGDGTFLSDIVETAFRLSDCQPIVTAEGLVTWYVTDGDQAILYQINPYQLEEYQIPFSFNDDTGTGTWAWASDYIYACYEEGIITGYSDSDGYSFYPSNNLTRAEAATIIARALGLTFDENADYTVFSDDDGTGTWSWASEYIYACAQAGIINGYEDDTFLPDQNVTRVELAKMIAVAEQLALDAAESSFSDVSSDHWGLQYIEACVKAGIVNGYTDGTFLPANNVTRAEAAAMIARALGLTE